MTRLLLLLCALVLAALPAPTLAQEDAADPALLVADQVFVEDGERLVATGNVEALHNGTRLVATRIVYDQTDDTLIIDGPIRITDETGNLLLADSAELDQGFRNGILRGARLVMDEQLQLASVEARRVNDRYTQLSRVAVTSCQVCGRNQLPLWQIRASRVIHDEEERQLYFDNAQLRVLDVPIFWVPRMRLPDPTLKRARGFLVPSVRSTTLLGFGLKLPYFIPIGDHQDITVTPYLSPVTRTLELRYRRAFVNGDLQIDTALTRDSLVRNSTRGYLFAEGHFGLRGGFELDFDLEYVSDEAYLNDYDYASKERLNSNLTLTRVRRDDFLRASLTRYQSLLDTEDDETLPSLVMHTEYEKRFFPARLGGELRLGTVLHGHYRQSDLNVDSADADSVVDGRDVARLEAEASWRRRWTLAGGLRLGVEGYLWADRYAIRQDAASEEDASQLTPGASVELRWPLIRRGPEGGRTLLEPVVQYGWVGGDRPRVSADESTRVEFDEANLFTLSRFPAGDRRERGQMAAVGLRWLHEAPAGWRAGLTLGRVWHEETDPAFSRSSGLDSRSSDWLISGGFANPLGLSISARGLLAEDGEVSKAEARAGWSNDRIDLGASYVLLVADPAEDRDETQSEWTLDATYRMTTRWTGTTEWRYDLADQRLDRAGLGLQYRNECVQVDVSVSRRFASSTNLEPSTDFGLTVALTGFGTSASAKEYRRTCN